MASSVIHMCVAKKMNEVLKIRDENMLLLGSIAPDISKCVGRSRDTSHFVTNNGTVDMDYFLSKYQDKLNDPFMLGYYIHLYTDFLWEKYFITEIIKNDSITMLDGTKVENTEEAYRKLIYSDYTNLNIQLLDEYNLDLALFYEETKIPDVYMDEIPVDQLSKLLDYTGVIIANTKKQKAYTFKLENIKPFIKTSTDLILSELDKLL